MFVFQTVESIFTLLYPITMESSSLTIISLNFVHFKGLINETLASNTISNHQYLFNHFSKRKKISLQTLILTLNETSTWLFINYLKEFIDHQVISLFRTAKPFHLRQDQFIMIRNTFPTLQELQLIFTEKVARLYNENETDRDFIQQ
jgi:hypothetical protein